MRLLFLICLLSGVSFANDTLVVDVRDFRPFCIKTDSGYTGFAIELWENIALHNNYQCRYHHIDKFSEIFPRIISGKSQIAPHGITITEDREHIVDFSYPFFQSGLSVLIKPDGGDIINYLIYVFNMLKGIMVIVILFVIFCVIISLLMWKAEQGNDMFHDDLRKGWWDGFYWVTVVVTTVGFGDKVPKSNLGKAITMIVMFTGIFVVLPMTIGKVSSEMTTEKISRSINGPEDLKGKEVAVQEGTVAEEITRQYGAKLIKTRSLRESVLMLKAGEVKAVVHDYPVLREISLSDKKLEMTNGIFAPQDYGIVVAQDSPLREGINRALISFIEDGTYQKLYDRYFGK